MTLLALLVVLSQTDSFSAPPMVEAPDQAQLTPSHESELMVRRAPPSEPEYRRVFELAVPGAVVALAGWAAGWVTFFGSIDCSLFGGCRESASVLLLIPQLGPWLAIMNGGTSDRWFVHNLGLGLAQAIGLTAMVTGFALRVPTGDDAVSMSVAPTANGVALGGSF